MISDSEKLIAIYRVVLKLERKGLISKLVMGDLLYLVPIAVKDYEVTRLLHDKR